MGKGKSKDGGNEVRTGWKEPAELKDFCDLCATQVLDGKRNGGFFRREGVDAMIEQLGEMGKVVTHTQKLEASDEWWTRKLQACPKALTFKNKPLPNVQSMEIIFEGMVATGKNAFCTSGEIPKECTKGFGDSADSKEFVDPQCEPSVNVDPMEVEGPSSSWARSTMNKGKCSFNFLHQVS
ncbi:uncharacterized protein LOC126727833 [Quercus robur]|uniref:uncharacterized protein LOC126727833 n=1 Tax=Quercus robur TaxID=38942 RepID=UPI00216226C7|nr:uncharacterized protein LOC126727833 [Quercus robur]